MIPSRLPALAVLVPLTFIPPAHAQVKSPPLPAATAMDRFVVTSTRTEQSIDSTLGAVDVITREDIERADFLSLAELLRAKAGLDIRATGGAGQPVGIFLRGSSATHTLVLVDGVRVQSSTSGAAALEHIPTELIERIEIVKGPLSGVYGSDAIGGVVQIFTRRHDQLRLSTRLGVGNDSAHHASAGFATVENKVALSVDAGIRRINSGSATNARAGFLFNDDRDPYRNQHVQLKISHQLWQGEKVLLTAWQSKSRTDFDSGPGAAQNRQTLSGLTLSSENRITPTWQSRLLVGQTVDDLDALSAFPSRFRTTQSQATWVNIFKTGLGHLSAGLEYRREKVGGSVDYDEPLRTTRSLFAGYLEKLGAGQFEFHVRRDEETQYGARNTGSAAYGLTLSPALTAYIRAGSAFRAPSFNDLYYPGFSNPNLLPEKSRQGEAGVKWRSGPTRVQMAAFHNRIRELIAFDALRFIPVNVARAQIRGVELSGETRLFDTALRAAVTHQRPRDADTGLQLRSRAKQFGSLTATREFGALSAVVDVAASGARYDSSNQAPATRMGGYALVNGSLRYRYSKLINVDFTVNNAGGKNYELAQGYNQARREYGVTVKLLAF